MLKLNSRILENWRTRLHLHTKPFATYDEIGGQVACGALTNDVYCSYSIVSIFSLCLYGELISFCHSIVYDIELFFFCKSLVQF